ATGGSSQNGPGSNSNVPSTNTDQTDHSKPETNTEKETTTPGNGINSGSDNSSTSAEVTNPAVTNPSNKPSSGSGSSQPNTSPKTENPKVTENNSDGSSSSIEDQGSNNASSPTSPDSGVTSGNNTITTNPPENGYNEQNNEDLGHPELSDIEVKSSGNYITGFSFKTKNGKMPAKIKNAKLTITYEYMDDEGEPHQEQIYATVKNLREMNGKFVFDIDDHYISSGEYTLDSIWLSGKNIMDKWESYNFKI
ncbi:hypothetical protein, partial [Ureaplasma diversum]|uniref:hypothetical protein n=1 Tax=Ureaplasma diversum TaxID=42094 RepID=UPI00056EEF54